MEGTATAIELPKEENMQTESDHRENQEEQDKLGFEIIFCNISPSSSRNLSHNLPTTVKAGQKS